MKKSNIVTVLMLSVMTFALAPIVLTSDLPIELAAEDTDYFVCFKGNKLPLNADIIIEECGGIVTSKFPKIAVLVAEPLVDPIVFEAALSERNEILGFEHDYIVELPDTLVIPVGDEMIENTPTVTDPYYWQRQWHLWHTIEASPEKAWSITTGDPEIKVAVLDTGIDYNHGDIAPNYDFELSMSFVPYEDEMDWHGHGTWCGGIVAAAINNDPDDWKVVGIGPDLTLVNLKVMDSSGSGSFSWIFEAVYYAVANDIDVISMSLGAYVPAPAEGAGPFLGALNQLFRYATRNDVVCIASAGNLNLDMDVIHPYLHVPSQSAGVIAVIATDIYDGKAGYSNYGSTLTGISAPGGDYAWVPPDWYYEESPNPYPVWNYWYGLTFSTFTWTGTGGAAKYAWWGGTSMAAPHVAGVAGLLLSMNHDLNPSQVWHYIKLGATDIGPTGYDQYFNFGLLNAYNSLYELISRGKGLT